MFKVCEMCQDIKCPFCDRRDSGIAVDGLRVKEPPRWGSGSQRSIFQLPFCFLWEKYADGSRPLAAGGSFLQAPWPETPIWQ